MGRRLELDRWRLSSDPRRSALLDVVFRHPGRHIETLRVLADLAEPLPRHKVKHHVRMLARAGSVETIRFGRGLHVFPPIRGRVASRALAALHQGRAVELFRLVFQRGPISHQELLHALKWDASVLSATLRRFVRVGLFRRPPRSHRARYGLGPAVTMEFLEWLRPEPWLGINTPSTWRHEEEPPWWAPSEKHVPRRDHKHSPLRSRFIAYQ